MREDTDTSERSPIDMLAEEFTALCRKGAPPSIEDYAARYPELADEIRDLFPPVAMMEELKRRRQAGHALATTEVPRQIDEFRIPRDTIRGAIEILDNQPDLAPPVGAPERLLNLYRGNRTVAGLIATATAAVVLALVVGWAGYVNTRNALQRESQRRAEADAANRRADENASMSLNAFEDIFNQLKGSDDFPSGAPSPRENTSDTAAMLQSVLNFYDRFAAKNETNINLQFEAAKAYGRIGDIRQHLGESNKAETAYRHAIESAQKLHMDFPDNDTYTALSGQLHSHLAALFFRTQRPGDAENNYRIALELQTHLAAKSSAEWRYHMDLARTRLAFAELLCKQNHFTEARALLEKSIRDLEPPMQNDPHVRPLLGAHYHWLSEALLGLGENNAAAEATRKAQESGPPLAPPRLPAAERPPPPPER